MFEGPSETVVKLDANLLDLNHHLTVIINENNVSKSFKGNKKIFWSILINLFLFPEGVVQRIKLAIIVVELLLITRSKKREED